MISTYDRAVMFAASAHEGQYRKYTGEAYVQHPIQVAEIIRDSGVRQSEYLRVVAVLHDVLEDTIVTKDEIEDHFGATVARDVELLSDLRSGNRAERLLWTRDRLFLSWDGVQNIKVADLIDNTESIKVHDPKFWKVYRVEKLMLLGCLNKADRTLWNKAYKLCVDDIS